MAITDVFGSIQKPPQEVETRLKRGRERHEKKVPSRRECIEFERGNQYVFLSEDGRYLKQQGTVTSPNGGKLPWRIRRNRNLIRPVVRSKVSAATQRVPSYDVNPSTLDPEDISAAQQARNICFAGYDLWRVRQATKRVIKNALVTDEGFAMPYWDSGVAPFLPTPDGTYVGMGEVKIGTWNANEVFWEPGTQFEESPWWAIEHARPIDVVSKEQGFIGGTLKADADDSKIVGKESKGKNLVMVTEFFERPCPEYPEGRRFVIANGRLIFEPEDYPLRDHDGNVIDEPCLHRLYYDLDPDSDRNSGLVRNLIDPQRAYNDALNKAAEWKNTALVPQILAPEGSILTERTDEPGAIIYFRTLPGMPDPKFQQVPNIPPELFQIADRAKSEMDIMGDQVEIPTQISSGQAVQSLLEREQLAWQSFLGDLADFHSRLMRDCLTLVQRFYTEPRLMQFRGRTGWEAIEDFRGADLRGQTDVYVAPGSLEPRTRDSIKQQVMNIAQMFPGYFPPEVLMSAMESGSAEKLLQTYDRDVERANRIIKRIKRDTFLNAPERPVLPGEDAGPQLDPNGQPVPQTDPATGQPQAGPTGQPVFVQRTTVPDWMPRPFDGISVQKAVFEDWMKTDEYDELPVQGKEAANLYYGALLDLESKKAQRDAQIQNQQAQNLGMQNAAAPQTKPMPSLPSVSGNGQQKSTP